MKRAASRVAGFVSKWATAFIGKYLENVSEDSFELGLSSGRLQLKNVKLRESVLEQLRLPIRVAYGRIETINISIPYGNILRPGGNSPLVVEIDDVSILAKFISESEFDSEKIENLVVSERLRLIEHWNIRFMTELAEDEYFTIKGGKGNSDNKPFFSRIISVLIQDIRLKFRRIHVRVEDPVNKDLSCGLVLDSLEVRSIPNLSQVFVGEDGFASKEFSSTFFSGDDRDKFGPELIYGYERQLALVRAVFSSRSESPQENWFDPFFQKKDSSDFSYRILDLDGLFVYVSKGAIPYDVDLESIKVVPKDFSLVVHPFCCKLLLRQRRDFFGFSKKPIYTIYGVLEEIYLTVSEQIISYCGGIWNQIQAFNRQIEAGGAHLERRFLYRPSVSVIGNAKIWWRYAVGCVIRERFGSSPVLWISRIPGNGFNSPICLGLQDDFTEAKISMYCRDYTSRFQTYFEEKMSFESIGPYFDGGLFNDLLLQFSRQFSEYYIVRIPFSRFVALHTSLVHQWVGKRLEVHSLRRAEQSDSVGAGGPAGWVQWLFKFHRISSPPLSAEDDIFFDASEGEEAENGEEEGDETVGTLERTLFSSSVELDEEYLAAHRGDPGSFGVSQVSEEQEPCFFDCISGESGGEIEHLSGVQEAGQALEEASPTIRTAGLETPFMIFRVLLRETKLEVELREEDLVPEAQGDSVSENSGKSAFMGSLRNFGLEFIRTDSRISFLSVLQEFVLDYSARGLERYHIIYEDESLVREDKMWFTFCYLSRRNSLYSLQGSSNSGRGAGGRRNRNSVSMSSDFSVDRGGDSRRFGCSGTLERSKVRINVEKCYINFYSNVISALICLINQYKSFSKNRQRTKKRGRAIRDNQVASTESGSTEVSDKKENYDREDLLLGCSDNLDVDIQIETPILVFCHQRASQEDASYNVISFGKISISNSGEEAVGGVDCERSSADDFQGSFRPENNNSLDFQVYSSWNKNSAGGHGQGGCNKISPYYRYVLSEKTTYWFKCVRVLCFHIRVEEIYISIYGAESRKQPGRKCRQLSEERAERRIPKFPQGAEPTSSYRLFEIDCIDVRLSLLSYKKYNMLDETWLKYVKLFGVLSQLEPFSGDLFEEKSFMSLVLSTNSARLDSKSGGGPLSAELFQFGDVLENAYFSVQVNAINSNFDFGICQSLYLNMAKWMGDSCLDQYFSLGKNLTQEKDFSMFRLGLNVQLFWFARLNRLDFDYVSDNDSCLDLRVSNLQVLNFVQDHFGFANFFVSDFSLDFLPGGPGQEAPDGGGEGETRGGVPLFSMRNSFSFARFPASGGHFVPEEERAAAEVRGGPRVKVKQDLGFAALHLRPEVVRELLELISKTAVSSGVMGRGGDLESGSENRGGGTRGFELQTRIGDLELVAFQRDVAFLRAVLGDVRLTSRDSEEEDTLGRREVVIGMERMSASNVCRDREYCFFRVERLLDSGSLEVRMISHRREMPIEDLVHGRLKRLVSSSELLVDAQGVTMVLFLDSFLHDIYYFAYLGDNIQGFMGYLEEERGRGGEAGGKERVPGEGSSLGDLTVSVPLRDVVFRESRLLVPSGTVGEFDSGRDSVPVAELEIGLFNFNNKTLIRDEGSGSSPTLVYLYTFTMVGIEISYIQGLREESREAEAAGGGGGVGFGSIPELSFHLRRYSQLEGDGEGRAGPFDLGCFVGSKEKEVEPALGLEGSLPSHSISVCVPLIRLILLGEEDWPGPCRETGRGSPQDCRPLGSAGCGGVSARSEIEGSNGSRAPRSSPEADLRDTKRHHYFTVLTREAYLEEFLVRYFGSREALLGPGDGADSAVEVLHLHHSGCRGGEKEDEELDLGLGTGHAADVGTGGERAQAFGRKGATSCSSWRIALNSDSSLETDAEIQGLLGLCRWYSQFLDFDGDCFPRDRGLSRSSQSSPLGRGSGSESRAASGVGAAAGAPAKLSLSLSGRLADRIAWELRTELLERGACGTRRLLGRREEPERGGSGVSAFLQDRKRAQGAGGLGQSGEPGDLEPFAGKEKSQVGFAAGRGLRSPSAGFGDLRQPGLQGEGLLRRALQRGPCSRGRRGGEGGGARLRPRTDARGGVHLEPDTAELQVGAAELAVRGPSPEGGGGGGGPSSRPGGPLEVESSGDFSFWVMNPEHGYFEPLLEECGLGLSLAGSGGSGTQGEAFSSPKSRPGAQKAVTRTLDGGKRVGGSGHFGSAASAQSVLIGDGQEAEVDQISAGRIAAAPGARGSGDGSSSRRLSASPGRASGSGSAAGPDFEALFSAKKAVNLESTGKFAVYLGAAEEGAGDGSSLFRCPYLFYEVEHRSATGLGVEKVLRITSPLQVFNELDTDVEVLYSQSPGAAAPPPFLEERLLLRSNSRALLPFHIESGSFRLGGGEGPSGARRTGQAEGKEAGQDGPLRPEFRAPRRPRVLRHFGGGAGFLEEAGEYGVSQSTPRPWSSKWAWRPPPREPILQDRGQASRRSGPAAWTGGGPSGWGPGERTGRRLGPPPLRLQGAEAGPELAAGVPGHLDYSLGLLVQQHRAFSGPEAHFLPGLRVSGPRGVQPVPGDLQLLAEVEGEPLPGPSPRRLGQTLPDSARGEDWEGRRGGGGGGGGRSGGEGPGEKEAAGDLRPREAVCPGLEPARGGQEVLQQHLGLPGQVRVRGGARKQGFGWAHPHVPKDSGVQRVGPGAGSGGGREPLGGSAESGVFNPAVSVLLLGGFRAGTGSLSYPSFVLNRNRSWKLLLLGDDDDDSVSPSSYLLVVSISERSVGSGLDLLGLESTSSVYIYNGSKRKLAVSQRVQGQGGGFGGKARERLAKFQQTFPPNSFREFVWQDYFGPRELRVRAVQSSPKSLISSLENEHSIAGGRKAKYINLSNHQVAVFRCPKSHRKPKPKPEKSGSFQVYDLGSSNRADWVVFKVSKVSSKNDFVIGLFSYEDFMDWHSSLGLTRRALSLLSSPSKPPGVSSPRFRPGNPGKAFQFGGGGPSNLASRTASPSPYSPPYSGSSPARHYPGSRGQPSPGGPPGALLGRRRQRSRQVLLPPFSPKLPAGFESVGWKHQGRPPIQRHDLPRAPPETALKLLKNPQHSGGKVPGLEQGRLRVPPSEPLKGTKAPRKDSAPDTGDFLEPVLGAAPEPPALRARTEPPGGLSRRGKRGGGANRTRRWRGTSGLWTGRRLSFPRGTGASSADSWSGSWGLTFALTATSFTCSRWRERGGQRVPAGRQERLDKAVPLEAVSPGQDSRQELQDLPDADPPDLQSESFEVFEDAPLWMNQFENFQAENCSKLISKIRKHYEHELYSQLYVIATSLGSVGNPVNSFTNIGAGIGDLFLEPIYAVTSKGSGDDGCGNGPDSADASREGGNGHGVRPGGGAAVAPDASANATGNGGSSSSSSCHHNASQQSAGNVVSGVKKGIESFMNHSVFGTFQAISKVAGTASQIAGALTMDERYMEERRKFVHGQQPKDLMDGISIGAQAFGKSVTDGLSSLVGEVLDGATTGNPNSLAIGITKGLVAAVVKPITGVLDFTQKAAQGIQKASA
ncbi:putative vacuolar protein sorting-associated protein, partial [Cryptosporidium felis]